jgi:hypothetical protein
MRSRKPCVFARWRLFGWNVRLLTGDSRFGAATTQPGGYTRMRARQTALGNWVCSRYAPSHHWSNQAP